MITKPRLVEVRQNVLKHNDVLARSLRQRFEAAGVYVISLVSSPGSGKTTLLEQTLTRLRASGCRVAALVGDLATENDAARLARSEAPVKQIITGTVCHLDAEMVSAHSLTGSLMISIASLSKTSATWSVPPVTISAKICELF